ncbi:MAG: polyphenol oxidase family protein, partial [Anaerolineales bacterium]|nr:polyphenol oxidase family protein [Anaerolineales bacterium]
MPFLERDGIRTYSFEQFPATVTQAVFTRRGGVSPAPWASLNFGGTVGDDLANVRENRLRAFAVLGRNSASLFDVCPVHGVDVAFGDEPRDWNIPESTADTIF